MVDLALTHVVHSQPHLQVQKIRKVQNGIEMGDWEGRIIGDGRGVSLPPHVVHS